MYGSDAGLANSDNEIVQLARYFIHARADYLTRHPDWLKSMTTSSVNDAFDDSDPIRFHHLQLNHDRQCGRFLYSASAPYDCSNMQNLGRNSPLFYMYV